ncbi:MAG: hypothetical protein JRN26_02685 [Nitrososphaerota archaeon]|nr:hypothetical protein [Nitrososphaerota archaeon]MDG6927347.1 hypothetical protein [Nitrososphaerota archaeon]MDG6930925.1 hypothetical protein [Nitrososphaerota archaeon]MDG6932225.1 hypothetical protein [Nitrososphaerota archaeon]MDG6935782.1 hypothetical protein [Nitrososphaerota archaeon]
MKLKICGITTVEDAITAKSLGADMIGVIGIQGTPRAISAEELAKIRLCIKEGLVFVTDSVDAAEAMMGTFDLVQVHAVIEEEMMDKLHGKVIAYVPANDFGTNYIKIVRIHGFTPLIHAVNGRLQPGDLVKFGDISDSGIAGGIGVDNVNQFVGSGATFLDISSGVEDSPGKKSPWKIRQVAGMVK